MASQLHRRYQPNFWSIVLFMVLVMIALSLFLPIGQVFLLSFTDAVSGNYTLANYAKIFSHKYYVTALKNTVIVGVLGMLGACLLGIPLAYCMSRYYIPGKALVSTLAVLDIM